MIEDGAVPNGVGGADDIGGGVTIQRFLNAGLIDELTRFEAPDTDLWYQRSEFV